ncbi:MAG: hypothetical protein QG556_931 [Pseudomonadota bacterium]|nr:hypothetical protein [Pseudomonadota bacterium]
MAANTRDNYLSYHQNSYFSELNESLLNHLSESNSALFSIAKKNHIQLLNKKHEIDCLLNRKNEIQKNIAQFEKYGEPVSDIYTGISITNSVKDTITQMNNPRLDHAVWSRNMAEVMILFLGVSTPELSRLLALISVINGYASYGFYVVRGGIDLAVGVSHVLDTKLDELGIDQNDRFQFQKEQRYGRITNDIALWAPVNFTTFHYLYGPGFLGFLGTVLTVALLVGDTLLTYVVYRHKESQFQEFFKSIEDEAYKSELKKIHDEQQEKLFYTMVYQGLLVASFSLFLANTLPFILTGSIAICILQVLFKEKDLYLDLLKTKAGSNEEFVIQAKMFISLLEHLSIPAIFLVAGLVVMPMLPGISPLLILLGCCAVSALMMKASADLSAHVENSYPKIQPQTP